MASFDNQYQNTSPSGGSVVSLVYLRKIYDSPIVFRTSLELGDVMSSY